MKTYLRLSVVVFGLIASVAVANAVEENVNRVTTSRSLKVASVRNIDDKTPWYIMQQAFASSMSASLSTPGKDMPVKMIPMAASQAAADLENRGCDAVLVLGERVPYELRKGTFTSLRAVCPLGTPVRVFHIVLRNSDPGMKEVLGNCFEEATSSVAFQETVGWSSAMRVVASKNDP